MAVINASARPALQMARTPVGGLAVRVPMSSLVPSWRDGISACFDRFSRSELREKSRARIRRCARLVLIAEMASSVPGERARRDFEDATRVDI